MAKETNPNNNANAPALLLAVWAVVLLVSFLANRGDDVGKLGQLAGNLGGGPLLGWDVFGSLIGAVIASLIAAAWFGLGSLIASYINYSRQPNHSHVLELALKTAIGASAWSTIWFLLGFVGGYGGVVALVALVAGVASAVLALRRVREARSESRVPEMANAFDKALLFLTAITVGLAFIASLAPPTAKDTLLYHFAVPKVFIAQGGNAVIEGHIASYLALGTEMHSVWAMLLGGLFSERAGEAAGSAVIWLFMPILLMAIFGWARELRVERRWALLAVLMIASVPTIYHVSASAYIDVALAVLITLAIYAVTRWWQTLESGWLIMVAIFLGAALSAKLTTLFVIAAFGLIILLRVRKAQTSEPDKLGKIAGLGFAALILAGVIASPWYLRTWAETGSPVFPFYMSIWPATAPGWDADRSGLYQGMNAQYGGYEKTPLDYLASPWNISIRAQPEIATHFDGVLGVAFLIGLPILVIGLWKFDLPVEAKIGVGVAAIMFLFWLFSSQQLRYLLPILPVIAIAIVIAASRMTEPGSLSSKVMQYSVVAACVAGVAVSAAWFLQKSPVRVVLGGETKDQYLTRNIDYYPYYQWLNTETDTHAKVWLINMRRDTYNLERPYFSDYLFEDWTLKQLVWESRSADELKAKAAAMNITYILSRHDFLFDHKVSPLVDDQRPMAENDAKLRMARELLLDPARTVKADNRFSLVKVF